MVTTILGNGRALSGAGRDAGYTNFRDASFKPLVKHITRPIFVRNWPFEIIDLFQTAVFAHPRIFGPVAHMALGEEPACVPQIIVMNCV